MKEDEHLNQKGLIKIINLITFLNKGVLGKLKLYFSNIIKINRSKVNLLININCNWVSGFLMEKVVFI